MAMGSTSLLMNSEPQQWTLPGAPPLYATRRNPAAYTEGPQIGVVARTLGTPLLPWQQYVADVAGERNPDGSYAYEIVVVSVPRQTGKTTLIRSMGVQRGMAGRDVFYTAQTGKDARARWFDLVKLLRVNNAFKRRVTVALRGGSEHVLWPSGAVFQCFAPTPESLHGYTPPTVVIDEAFAQTGIAGELLMGAIDPAQFTIVDKQIWIVSTMGTAESVFLHDWIDRGMAGGAGIACFVWGARDDQNPYDLDDIAQFHPGVGFQLGGKIITPEDVLKAVEKNTRSEYERAYGNRRTATLTNLIEAQTWRDLRYVVDKLHPKPTFDLAASVLGYEVAHDRQSATITALWRSTGGDPCGMVLRHQAGTSWLVDELDDLARSGRPLALAARDSGPVLEVTKALKKLGHQPVVLGEREYATGSGAFLTRIDDKTLSWYAIDDTSAELLERSVTGLVPRPAAVDGVAFSGRLSVGDASPAISYVVGLAALEAQHEGKPTIRF